ncbi:MAG: histidine phosphatase family protein [Xanthomonadales bacterium]|jgi:broad specificity phosphatase PhoE|nr:histidine phosphatase family protein [Xanthomonadales bacterium]
MATLWLLRHGQANFSGDSYDQLSPLGFAQARRFGEWLHAHETPVHRSFRGQLRRHRETLEALREHAPSVPEAEVLPGFDEYQFERVLRAYLALHPECPEYRIAAEGREPGPWIRVLHRALGAWAEHRLDHLDVEPFGDFTGRIGAALNQVLADAGPRERVLVVTSGGVISVILQAALGVPWRQAVRFNLALKNASLTELKYRDAGVLELHTFNALPHLAGPADRPMHTLV